MVCDHVNYPVSVTYFFLSYQVRLLTGISRYHEMGYIIGLLIEHDQFESLVNKGVEKVCV